MAKRTNELYTIGFEKRSLSDFIRLLEANHIEALADIRANPHSRKKGFSKKALSALLESRKIQYAHFIELGAPKAIRDRVHVDHDYETFFKDYEKYLNSQSVPFQSLLQLATSRRTCLFCYECDPNFCHRKTVAEMLHSRSGDTIEIRHLT